MADYTLSAKGTYDGSSFNRGISSSSSVLDSFTSKCSSVGSKVTRGLSKVASVGAKVTGVFGALSAGAFMKGGIDRALNIEQAQFKLGQLGMDVQSVMASASTAVDGTAFSLGSAATSASLMGAAGVQAGDQMTKALQASTGIAAIGGVQMERVSQVFSKVAAQGKLQGDELMQLSEMGVNATGALAKHLGKTQAEVTKMVSAGKIDFQTFSDSMYETFGEAAYGANATFSGAMSNVRAALSRVSAKFADPALRALKGVFIALIPAINAVSIAIEPMIASFAKFVQGVSGRVVAGLTEFTDALKETGSFALAFSYSLNSMFSGTAVGEFFAMLADSVGVFFETIRDGGGKMEALKNAFGSLFDALKSKVDDLPKPLQVAMGVFSSLGQGLMGVFDRINVGGAIALAGFVALLTKFRGPLVAFGGGLLGIGSKATAMFRIFAGAPTALSGLVQGISKLNPAFAGLHASFASAGGGLSGLKAAFGGLLSPVGLVVGIVAALVAGFVYLMATNEDFRNSVMSLAGQIGAALAPALMSIGAMISNLAETVLPLIIDVANMLLPVIGQIILVVMQVAAALAPIIATLMGAIIPIITQIIQLVVEVAAQVMSVVLPIISAILEAVQAAMPLIQGIIQAAMGVIQQVITTVWPIIQAYIESAMDVIKMIIDNVWPIIQSIIETVMHVIQDVISIVTAAISGDWSGVWNGIKKLFSDIWEGIKNTAKNAIDGVFNIVTGIKDKIVGFFSGAGKWLIDAGKSIIQGLIDGIQKMLGPIGDAVGGLMDFVGGFFPHSPAKRGAFSGRGWSLYSGRAIPEALAMGINGTAPKAVAAIAGMMDSVSRPFEFKESPFMAAPGFTQAHAETHVAKSGVNMLTKSDMYDAMEMALSPMAEREIAVYVDGRKLASSISVQMDAEFGRMQVRSSR